MSTDPGAQADPPASTDQGAEADPAASHGPEPPEPTPATAARRKTTREAADERRQAKLDLVQEQVESGSLVIRPMTDEERSRYPPRPIGSNRMTRR